MKKPLTIDFLEQQNKVLLEMLRQKYLAEPIQFTVTTEGDHPMRDRAKILKTLRNGGLLKLSKKSIRSNYKVKIKKVGSQG